MKPGATTSPSALMISAPSSSIVSAIFSMIPPFNNTSALYPGLPLPSTIKPFLINFSSYTPHYSLSKILTITPSITHLQTQLPELAQFHSFCQYRKTGKLQQMQQFHPVPWRSIPMEYSDRKSRQQQRPFRQRLK